MKKTITLSLFTFLSISLFSQITSPTPYCNAKFNHNYNMFKDITIKGQTVSFGSMGSFSVSNTYLYFNNITLPDFVAGDTASIAVNVYSVGDIEPIYYALWIDYNQNNTFEASEIVMQNNGTTNAALPTSGTGSVTKISKTITIPTTANTGVTRARLMRTQHLTSPYAAYNASYAINACPTFNQFGNLYGCAYDFDINIVGGTTPVRYVSFMGSSNNGMVSIKWQTAEEINNKGFDVEESIDGVSFNKVGFVESKQNANSVYSFSKNVINNTSTIYYRLKQIDINGKFEYSQIIKINLVKKTEDVLVFPTIANNVLQLNLDASQSNTIGIYNTIGKLVKQLNNYKQIQLDITSLPKGNYFIKCNNNKPEFFTKL